MAQTRKGDEFVTVVIFFLLVANWHLGHLLRVEPGANRLTWHLHIHAAHLYEPFWCYKTRAVANA